MSMLKFLIENNNIEKDYNDLKNLSDGLNRMRNSQNFQMYQHIYF